MELKHIEAKGKRLEKKEAYYNLIKNLKAEEFEKGISKITEEDSLYYYLMDFLEDSRIINSEDINGYSKDFRTVDEFIQDLLLGAAPEFYILCKTNLVPTLGSSHSISRSSSCSPDFEFNNIYIEFQFNIDSKDRLILKENKLKSLKKYQDKNNKKVYILQGRVINGKDEYYFVSIDELLKKVEEKQYTTCKIAYKDCFVFDIKKWNNLDNILYNISKE